MADVVTATCAACPRRSPLVSAPSVASAGFLTREYLDGRRKRYVAPIQKDTGWRSPPMQAAASKAQARTHLDGEEFEREFARSAAIQSKSWIFLLIPLFAAELALLWVPTLNVYRAALFFITLRLMH